MQTVIIDTHVLPDGHLACPPEFLRRAHAQFKIIAIFEDSAGAASDQDIERAAALDASEDYLTPEELRYYAALGEPERLSTRTILVGQL